MISIYDKLLLYPREKMFYTTCIYIEIYLARLQNHKETKRRLFDFVSEISKTLYGTLADTDTNYYNSELGKTSSIEDIQKNIM